MEGPIETWKNWSIRISDFSGQLELPERDGNLERIPQKQNCPRHIWRPERVSLKWILTQFLKSIILPNYSSKNA